AGRGEAMPTTAAAPATTSPGVAASSAAPAGVLTVVLYVVGAYAEFAPRVADEHEHVQGPERERLHDQEIGRPDTRPVVAQEGPPTLTGRTGGSAAAGLLDRGPADRDPELE